MNEKIKELAEQAINYATSKRPLPDLKDKDLFLNNLFEKFAELIVQECLSIVDDAERGDSNEVWDNAVKFIRRDLKEHFGVEE